MQPLGNPWTIKEALESNLFKPEFCAEIVVGEYDAWLTRNESVYSEHLGRWFDLEDQRDWILENIHTLRGKNLACWCPLDKPCHADVLLQLVNKEPK